MTDIGYRPGDLVKLVPAYEAYGIQSANNPERYCIVRQNEIMLYVKEHRNTVEVPNQYIFITSIVLFNEIDLLYLPPFVLMRAENEQ